jgi:hypothetical protein
MTSRFNVRGLFRVPAPMQSDPFGIDAALAERKAARPARVAAAKRGREARA